MSYTRLALDFTAVPLVVATRLREKGALLVFRLLACLRDSRYGFTLLKRSMSVIGCDGEG